MHAPISNVAERKHRHATLSVTSNLCVPMRGSHGPTTSVGMKPTPLLLQCLTCHIPIPHKLARRRAPSVGHARPAHGPSPFSGMETVTPAGAGDNVQLDVVTVCMSACTDFRNLSFRQPDVHRHTCVRAHLHPTNGCLRAHAISQSQPPLLLMNPSSPETFSYALLVYPSCT